jgi:hypothetical protein
LIAHRRSAVDALAGEGDRAAGHGAYTPVTTLNAVRFAGAVGADQAEEVALGRA